MPREYFIESHVDDSNFFQTKVKEFSGEHSNSASYGAPVRLIVIFNRLSTHCNLGWCLELLVNFVELELLPLLDTWINK